MSALKVGIIGGSGLGSLLGAEGQGQRHEVDTPFGRPSDAVVQAEWEGIEVFLLARHGPGHLLNPSAVPYRANIFALKQLGVTHIIATGAVGSLREEMRPRDLVIADQMIDKTQRRSATFFEKAAVHVELAEPFCPVLRQILMEAAKSGQGSESGQGLVVSGQEGKESNVATDFTVHDRGCYVCMEGPGFSTRAESLMHRLWGGDLIGMTAMPEAKLAREAEISYALVALVTDYDCWRQRAAMPAAAQVAATNPNAGAVAPTSGMVAETGKDELLKEIIGNLSAATGNALRLIRRALGRLAEKGESLAASPAHRALELAIWSDKGSIPAEEVQRLSPIWIKYFGERG